MSEGLNRVQLLGTLGADPEMRFSQGGIGILKLRMATNERVKKGDQWEDHTEWHDVTVLGKRAEGLAKILAKGSSVMVEGPLRTSSWEKDGVKRFRTEVLADKVFLTGGKRADGASSGGGGGSRYGASGHGASAKHTGDRDDRGYGDGANDDLPFVYIASGDRP